MIPKLKPKSCAFALLGSAILAFGLYNVHSFSGVTEGGVLGLTLLLACDGSGILRVGLGCAILHESGHALAYRTLWGHWPELEISPFGICLRLRGLPMPPAQELALAAAYSSSESKAFSS